MEGGLIVRDIILIICVAALLLPMEAGVSGAAEPELTLPGPGGSPADIDREVLWLDNPDYEGQGMTSEVIGEYDIESEFANDFFLEQPATIRKVTWWGVYWNGYEGTPTGTGFNLRFYYDNGNCLPEELPFLEFLLPGDICCERYFEGGDQFSQYTYEFCLELDLAAGSCWFSAQMADHAFPPQWGRLSGYVIRLCESAFRSAYFSYPDWVPGHEICTCDASQMFEDVCEPTAVESASWGAVKALYR
jgi:hypothetical protein